MRCPSGHSWQADVHPPAVGETTRVLPACPICGEIGEPEPALQHEKLENAPTSQIEEQEPDVETSVLALLPDQPLPTIAGYDLLEEIGRGGMGIVYRALDKRRQMVVAVKLLPRLDPGAVLHFKQEFRALADVQHPNLAAVYELGVADGFFFLVMEHVTGLPLTEYFLRIADIAERLNRLRPALRQLIAGLQHLHDNGLLHCDVKPGNVLVTPNGRVVLLDFGLVTAFDGRARVAGDLVGSIGYIAPERYSGKAATPASDWYAVGVMLFEVLTGRRPFSGARTRLIWQHQHYDPPAPSEFVPDVSDDWNRLCLALLQRDPVARPDGAEILTRVGLPAGVPNSANPRTNFLLGRDEHFLALRTALQTVESGTTVLVQLRGRSGMGKTALVERFLERVQRNKSIWLLRGRCHENESVPFKGVDGLVDAVAQILASLPEEELDAMLPAEMATLARAFPVLRRVKLVGRGWKTSDVSNPVELRRRVVAILRELLARFAGKRPIVMFIDDFQWSDLDSAHILVDLLAAPAPPPALIIIGSRSEDAQTACLRHFTEHVPDKPERFVNQTLELDSLTALESSSLAQALMADFPQTEEDWATRVAVLAGGWPVHVHELCRYLRSVADGGDIRQTTQDLSLRSVIEARLRGLTSDQRQLIEVLAVAGQPLPLDVALPAAQLPRHLRSALVLLRRDHWLRSQPGPMSPLVECGHSTIREAVLAMLPASRIVEHHERLATAYATMPESEPELIAAHLLAAGRGDEAVEYYEAAAQRAEEKLAFERAATLLRLTIDLKQHASDAAERLQVRLAEALVNAGHGAEAAAVFLQVSRQANRTQALRLRRLAAYHYCTSGHLDEGLVLLRDVLAHAGITVPSSPERLRAALAWERLRRRIRGIHGQRRSLHDIADEDLERIELCWVATAGLSLVDVVAGAYYQCLHLRYALAAGEPVRLARALAWEAAHLSTEGPAHFAKAERLVHDARTRCADIEQPYTQALLALVDGIIAHNRGAWSAARASLLQAEEAFRLRCFGVAWERATTHVFLFWALYQLGAFAELRTLEQRLAHDARERGDRFAATSFATFAAPLALLIADRPHSARATVRAHMADWTEPGFHLPHLTALWSECRADLYDDCAEAGLRRLTEAWPSIRKAELFRVQTVRITFWSLKAALLSACTAAASDSRHLRDLQQCERELHQEQLPWAAAHALVARGTVACRQRDLATATESLAEAAALFVASDMPAHAAAAKWWLGHLTTPVAEDMVKEALCWFQAVRIVAPERFCRMLLGASLPTR